MVYKFFDTISVSLRSLWNNNLSNFKSNNSYMLFCCLVMSLNDFFKVPKKNFWLNLHYHSDATKSTDSFSEFEEMWIKMGEEMERTTLPHP